MRDVLVAHKMVASGVTRLLSTLMVSSDPRARFLIDCGLKTHRLQQEKIGIGPLPGNRCYAIFQGSGGLLWKVLGIKNRAKSGCLDA